MRRGSGSRELAKAVRGVFLDRRRTLDRSPDATLKYGVTRRMHDVT